MNAKVSGPVLKNGQDRDSFEALESDLADSGESRLQFSLQIGGIFEAD